MERDHDRWGYRVRILDLRGRRAGDLDPENRGACDPAFPGADALWTVRAGGGMRRLAKSARTPSGDAVGRATA
jgi:hypothetical protein